MHKDRIQKMSDSARETVIMNAKELDDNYAQLERDIARTRKELQAAIVAGFEEYHGSVIELPHGHQRVTQQLESLKNSLIRFGTFRVVLDRF
jgi:hypothetical protein